MSNQTDIKTSIPDGEDDNGSYVEFFPPIPQITGGRNRKKCEHHNHIPHRTPSNTNRRDWHEAYTPQLKDMYSIIANTMDELYPKSKIRWAGNEKIAHNMSILIYHCSSKHISKYLDLPWDEIENKSKDLNL